MTTLLLPAVLLETARAFFEECGVSGYEGTAVIKTGPAGPELFVPDQRPSRGPTGGVSVEVTRSGQIQMALALGPDDLRVRDLLDMTFPRFAFGNRVMFTPLPKRCGPRCAAGVVGLHDYERFLRPRKSSVVYKQDIRLV